MAEKKLQDTPETQDAVQPKSKSNNLILYGLLVVNMLVVLAVGMAAFLSKEAPDPLAPIAKGVEANSEADPSGLNKLVGPLVPLETFLVNLSGTDGNRLLKVNLELEVSGDGVIEEIEKRNPQIRDIIIILLSSKSYREVSSKTGKDELRAQIKDTLNSFLTKGNVVNVLYTEFIFN